MIRDITGTILTPGNFGKDCLGDGRHYDKKGKLIECCCEDCGYLLCCTSEFSEADCKRCKHRRCPRNEKTLFSFLKGLRKL